MDHLDGKVLTEVGDDAPGRRRRGFDGVAAVGVGDVGGEDLDGAHRVAQVPLQDAVDAGVLEFRQRTAGAAGQGA